MSRKVQATRKPDCIEHGQAKGSRGGYGVVWVPELRRVMALHRWIFLCFNGYLPTVVRHTCDNPRCHNPDHLLGGTHADNVADKVARGRARGPSMQLDKRALTPAQVRAIRARLALREGPRDKVNGPVALGREFGVTHRTIAQIAAGANYAEEAQ